MALSALVNMFKEVFIEMALFKKATSKYKIWT